MGKRGGRKKPSQPLGRTVAQALGMSETVARSKAHDLVDMLLFGDVDGPGAGRCFNMAFKVRVDADSPDPAKVEAGIIVLGAPAITMSRAEFLALLTHEMGHAFEAAGVWEWRDRLR